MITDLAISFAKEVAIIAGIATAFTVASLACVALPIAIKKAVNIISAATAAAFKENDEDEDT